MKKAVPIVGTVTVAVVVLVLVLRDAKEPARTASPARSPGAQEGPLEPAPIVIGEDAICFNLAYRGLTCQAGQMEYGFAIGYGRPGSVKDNAFIEAVRTRAAGDVEVVYNRGFQDRPLSAIEIVEQQAKRFYFDANGDGKLSDDEVSEPVKTRDDPNWRQYDFVTPDFSLASAQGEEVPFRAKLSASFYGDSAEPSCMWSPACVLEGTSKINGKDLRLLLFTGGFEGEFFRYGRASYAFLDPREDPEYPPRAILSSLVFHEGTFYQLRFDGTHKEENLRAVLVKDTSPIGDMTLTLQGREALAARISYAAVKGKVDESIHFRIQQTQEFPVGQYVLNSGRFEFGRDDAYDWQVSLSKGPDFTIEQGQTAALELGPPKLVVSSVDENERYNAEMQNLDTFASSNNIYLTPVVEGADGETYSRFQKRDAQQFADVTPHLTIKGPAGQEIVSENLVPG